MVRVRYVGLESTTFEMGGRTYRVKRNDVIEVSPVALRSLTDFVRTTEEAGSPTRSDPRPSEAQIGSHAEGLARLRTVMREMVTAAENLDADRSRR
jgi:hypothetical protein